MPNLLLMQPRLKNKEGDRNVKNTLSCGFSLPCSKCSLLWDVDIIDEQIERV